ncbi:DUF6518 family protein [Sphaerisporangium aureirubrum]|uniref:DUF6518 family protein n=1 Tax=Sphaerisporangium aureirubrum TaxID=1544736 RepID=A0ABW1NRB9_9ACTN
MSDTHSPAAVRTRAGARVWVLSLGAALGGGLALGVLTNLAQGWLPGGWNQLANSGAVWTVAAFAAGAVLARRPLPVAVAGGLCAEAGLVAGYYGYAEFGRDGMGDLFFPLVWLAMAFVAGPLFGVAGAWWRRGRDRRRRVAGPAALAGVFGMEGLLAAWNLHHASQAWACLAAMVLVPLLLGRTLRERALTLTAAVPLALIAYAVVVIPLMSLSG